MRIIHCADIHLCSKLSANLEGSKRKERRAELLSTFLRMVDYADENEIDAIIVAGDLFDTGNISVTARNAVSDAIMNHPLIRFYYLRGNHDADAFLSQLPEIPNNLKLFGTDWTTYEQGGNVTVSGVELTSENSTLIYDTLVLENDKINIVVLHGQETGYVQKSANKAENIAVDKLKGKGIDYLALGHIHGYRMEQLDKRGVYCYCGCLEGRGFDECGEKGFVLLEIDEATDTVEPVFIPFAKRKLFEIYADVSEAETTSEAEETIREQLTAKHITPESMVKVVLQGYVSVTAELDTELLKKRFEDDYYFIKIYDETKHKLTTSQFMHEASLKGEFVRKVMASELEEDMKAEVIRFGLRALTGEEAQEGE